MEVLWTIVGFLVKIFLIVGVAGLIFYLAKLIYLSTKF